MRDQIHVKIEGVEKAVFNFKQLEKQKQADAQKELKKAAQTIRKNAKANVLSKGLVNTGELSKNIRTRKAGDYSYRVYVPKRIFYARFWELGTKRNPAKPFLFPAYNIQKPELLAKLAAMLKKGVK